MALIGALVSLMLPLLVDLHITADPVAVWQAALRDAIAASTSQPRPPLLAREVFLRQPTIDRVRLSPDGRLLAFLRYDGADAELLLQDVSIGTRTRVVANARGVDAAWSGDGRRLWIADADGLAVLDSATLVPKRILKWDVRRDQRLWRVDPGAPDFAIVQERATPGAAAPYRYLTVDASGKTELLHEAELPLRDVLLTVEGRLEFAVAYDGPGYDTVIRQFTEGGVRELLRCTGAEECRIVGYDRTQDELLIFSSHGRDKVALQRREAGTGHWETVHSDPGDLVDADSLLWSFAREDWLAVAYHRDRRQLYGNTDSDAIVLAALERHLPDANLQLSTSADDQLWLVRAQRANWPVARHFLYEPGPDRLQPLFEDDDAAAQAAPEEHLAAAQPVTWHARDGMLLHGYVYLPRGVTLKGVPLIAWLHGGPISRDYDEYHPAVQLLVNRGYAVFQPNFRISSGYGLQYTLAAQGDVGNGRVLADVLDGMDFLLEQGIGDRDRQAVMGHSFGGYLSLLAVSHYPERFRFAFAAAPPTDYGWMKQWQAENDSESLRGAGPPVAVSFRRFGLLYENVAWLDKMRRESPLAAVSNLSVPVYVWAGVEDDHVPVKSIVHYVGEARREGKSISLLTDPNAGHTPKTPLGTDAWLFLLENAAHRSFGGGVTPPSPDLEAFLSAHWRLDDVRR